MDRMEPPSPRASGVASQKRFWMGGALAAVGLVLMVMAYEAESNSIIMQWVPAKVLEHCSGSFAACRTKAAVADDADIEEVEPWGVQDSEGLAQRYAAHNATFRAALSPSAGDPTAERVISQGAALNSRSDSEAGGQASAGGNGTSIKCPETNIHGETMRAMSHMLPGVNMISVNESDAMPDQAYILKKLFARELAFPEERLRRAVSYGGNPERLQRVLQKLMRGEPINVATVGGSVTAGVGAESPNLSYRERLFEWIRKTFPHQNHTFANGALAAASSTYIHQCINDFVPVDTDLAIVEFTMNDSQTRCGVDNDGRRGFEVLLRKLLAYKNAPALIVLHWWSPRTKSFWESAEDEMDVYSKYYGLPALSWRDAAHDLMATNATGFTFEDIYFDKGHPNGYNGHRYLSEIVIGYMRNEAALMLLSGTAGAPVKTVSQLSPVPEPLIKGNYEGNSHCMRGDDFRDRVTEHEGWEWEDEGKNGTHKWGWVSWEPGARLVIKVNTKTYRGNSLIVVGLGILTSYERMGSASLACESGCECETKLIDGHTDEKVSQTEWVYHSVGQHEECVMSITNDKSTNDTKGEHKFKVNSFLVTNVHNSSAKLFDRIDKLAEKAAASEAYDIGHRQRQAARLKKEKEVQASDNSSTIVEQAARNTTRRRLAMAMLHDSGDTSTDRLGRRASAMISRLFGMD